GHQHDRPPTGGPERHLRRQVVGLVGVLVVGDRVGPGTALGPGTPAAPGRVDRVVVPIGSPRALERPITDGIAVAVGRAGTPAVVVGHRRGLGPPPDRGIAGRALIRRPAGTPARTVGVQHFT